MRYPRTSSAPSIRSGYGYRHRPARLTLGAAAVTVAAVATIAVTVSAGATPADGAASKAAAAAARVSQQHGSAGTALSRQATVAQPATQPPAHAPAKPAASAPARHRAQRAARARREQARKRRSLPYLIFDSATPGAIPGHHQVATYADGPHPVSPAAVAGRHHVLWIDINGSDPAAQILDIEPGCASPGTAPGWVVRRLRHRPRAVAVLYTMRSEWPAVQADVAGLPATMRARIRWWIADPTGHPHLVPGSNATQWYWGDGYDISTAIGRF